MAPRTTTIQNSIEIDRPAEVVFDYCVEPANEPEWNPRTRWIRRLGQGPLDVGSRFEGEWIKGSPMTVEFERFDRPTAWATFGRSTRLDATSEGTITELPPGTVRLEVRTTLLPHGAMQRLTPVLGPVMHHREQRNLRSIKSALEGTSRVHTKPNAVPTGAAVPSGATVGGSRGHFSERLDVEG
jgi:hypothetical protein